MAAAAEGAAAEGNAAAGTKGGAVGCRVEAAAQAAAAAEALEAGKSGMPGGATVLEERSWGVSCPTLLNGAARCSIIIAFRLAISCVKALSP